MTCTGMYGNGVRTGWGLFDRFADGSRGSFYCLDRANRGGDFYYDARFTRSAYRCNLSPDGRDEALGARLLREGP